MPGDLRELQRFIEIEYDCQAIHLDSHYARVPLEGGRVFSGMVEEFELKGHPHSKRCYSWSLRPEDAELKKYWPHNYFIVLQLAVVKDSASAVRWVYGEPAGKQTEE